MASTAAAAVSTIGPDLLAFFHDRLKVYLRDQGARHDLIDAVLALGDVNSSLDSVTSARSTWGGIMNRLGHAADNASNVSMNMNVSRSQLLDVDYAKATAELARSQIIQEAGSAMLSQANHQPLLVLHLLS